MANKKRSRNLDALQPVKKRRHQRQYHSDSESDNDEYGVTGGADIASSLAGLAESGTKQKDNFQAVSLLDSDDDIDQAVVDDGAETDSSSSSSSSEKGGVSVKEKAHKKVTIVDGGEGDSSSSEGEPETLDALRDSEPSDGSEDEFGVDDDDDDDEQLDDGATARPSAKSKRHDPAVFSTALQKILATKVSAGRRTDPVLVRSTDARKAAQAAADSVLERQARKLLRDQKRQALEKGRVKNVLLPSGGGRISADAADAAATSSDAPGDNGVGVLQTVSELVAEERRLRRVAQRGVVKLFNAVRTAQVKATEAEREVRQDGVLGIANRENKVQEMTKQGFLDLIASGGGGLSKKALQEA